MKGVFFNNGDNSLMTKALKSSDLQLAGRSLIKLPNILMPSNVKILNARENRIESVDEIEKLVNLEICDMTSNCLTYLPITIGKLGHLRELSLTSNQLKFLPSEIGDIVSLATLNVSNNNLTTIPRELGKLINLFELNLDNNQCGSLVEEIGNLTNLKSLLLRSNNIVTLPSEIGQLTRLTLLDVAFNQLISVPAEIGQLVRLKELRLENNKLRFIPSQIGCLTNLKTLFLSSNQLTHLPSEIGNLVYLKSLNFNDNAVTHLHPELGKLVSRLAWIPLYNNSFRFNYPDLGTKNLFLFLNELLPFKLFSIERIFFANLLINILSVDYMKDDYTIAVDENILKKLVIRKIIDFYESEEKKSFIKYGTSVPLSFDFKRPTKKFLKKDI